jgi:hypothetical protein
MEGMFFLSHLLGIYQCLLGTICVFPGVNFLLGQVAYLEKENHKLS